MLLTYDEMILMKWLHDPVYNEPLPKSMEWTLITILYRNFKFDRQFARQLRVCLPKANKSILLGKRFLKWGGRGGEGEGDGVLFKKATVHFSSGGIAREPC